MTKLEEVQQSMKQYLDERDRNYAEVSVNAATLKAWLDVISNLVVNERLHILTHDLSSTLISSISSEVDKHVDKLMSLAVQLEKDGKSELSLRVRNEGFGLHVGYGIARDCILASAKDPGSLT